MAALRLALMRSRKRVSLQISSLDRIETGFDLRTRDHHRYHDADSNPRLSCRSNWKQTGCHVLLRPKFYGFGYSMVLLSAKGHITPTILFIFNKIVGNRESLNTSSRFPFSSVPGVVASPVKFPPGRARVGMSPNSTGSFTVVKTIEIVVVGFLTATRWPSQP
jgi:hypothetical protein